MKNNIKWKKWSRNANGKQTHLSSNTALSYKNNQSTKTACSASKNRKLKRERERRKHCRSPGLYSLFKRSRQC